jgi:hypothetical protein
MKKSKKLAIKKVTLSNLDEPSLGGIGGGTNNTACSTNCGDTCNSTICSTDCSKSVCVGSCGASLCRGTC